jgi:cobalt/nickel transport system ATP-binding protein
MDVAIMEAKDMSYLYPDGTKALNGVNIKIHQGQTTAILGGNGAGKSTLFKCFNGIIKPSSGQLFFKNQQVQYSRKDVQNLRKSVGIVFQDPDSQLFSASVYQDISFGGINLKLPENEVRRRVDLAIKRTGIESVKDKPTHCLSFGQKKRVAIAGVLVMEPEVLILDEPTAGLDPKGVSDILKLLKEMQKELRLSVVFATHDIDIVPLYCDYAYVLDGGHVVIQGTPTDVFLQKNKLRSVNLRLTRIGHLMEILKCRDNFDFDENSFTISEARKELKRLLENGETK